MKKQFINVMMTLAIVFGLSVSAMAQDGLTPATAIWHLPGSTHSLTVDAAHTGTTFAWTASSVDCDGITAGTHTAPNFTTDDAAACVFSYPADAAGIYRFLVTETATDGGCTTAREFFTAIMNLNVIVIASDAAGDEISGGSLASCNDYTLRRTENPATLVGNEDTDDGGDALTTWTDAALFNERWVEVTLEVSDNSGCTVAGAPTVSDFAWQFTYTIDDGADDNFGDNFVGMQAVTDVTYSDPTALTGTISVEKGTSSIVIPLRSDIRWGTTGTDQDQQFIFTVDDASTVLDDGSSPYTYPDGREPATENTDNSSANQIIHASPATPRITIND